MKEQTIVYLGDDFKFERKNFRNFSKDLDKQRVDREVVLALTKPQRKAFKRMVIRDYTSPDGMLYIGFLFNCGLKQYRIYGRTYIIKKRYMDALYFPNEGIKRSTS